MARLREASGSRPLLAGPVEFGLLLHHPGSGTAIGSDDHRGGVYLVLRTASCASTIRHGAPVRDLADGRLHRGMAGRLDRLRHRAVRGRAGFQRVRDVDDATALRRALPMAARWLAGDMDLPVPPGSLGGAAALERLAELSETGLEPLAAQPPLATSRSASAPARLADAAKPASRLSARTRAAGIADEQARPIGALQHPVGTDDRITAGRLLLRRLAPTYEQLGASLSGG